MKIFAFDDEKNSTSSKCTWMKHWADLGDVFVFLCSTSNDREDARLCIKAACKDEPVLLMVHSTQCTKVDDAFVSPLLESCPMLFVMYVTGGSSSNEKSDNFHIHHSRRVVPSSQGLSYLKALFSKLCTALSNAGADKEKINIAWEEWESPVLVRLISMMAPLALAPEDEVLINFVAKRIREGLNVAQLQLAASELGNSEEEVELKKWIEQTDLGGHGLSAWRRTYPQALRELARGYL